MTNIYYIISSLFGLIPLAILALIFYLIIRKGGNEAGRMHHAYYYLISFISLAILFWAVSDLTRLLLKQFIFIDKGSSLVFNPLSTTAYNTFLKGISAKIAAIIVAFPVWGFHWMKANPPRPEEVDVKSRRTYSISIVVITMIIMLIGWPFLIYTVISKVLGVEDRNVSDILSTFIPYTISATALWLMHFIMWRKISSSEAKETKTDR